MAKQPKQKTRRPIPLLAWLLPCIVLLIGAAVSGWLFLRNPGADVVATVNGAPITRGELEMLMEDQRGAVRSYFVEQGLAYEDADFWNTPVNGITPMEYARDKAFQDMVDIKLQQLLQQEYGLTDDISFTSMEKRLNEENKRRKEVLEQGGIVYGVHQYTTYGFFKDEFNTLVDKLKEKLIEDKIILVGETSAWTYYQAHPEQFVAPAQYQIRAVYTPIPTLISEDGLDEATYNKLKVFADRLSAGASFDELVKEVQDGKMEGLQYQEITYNEETDLMQVEVVAELVKVLPDLKPGEVSSIVAYPHFYYTLGCYTSMVPEKPRSFQDAKTQSLLYRILTTQGYEALLEEQRSEAKIEKTQKYQSAVLPKKFR